jgi:hypothetical protein
MGRGTLALVAFASVAGVSGSAAARPEVFAEGLVGVSVAVSSGSYTEDHESASLHTGLRGGVWFKPGRVENRSAGRGRRVGIEAQIDRTSYGADYFYYTTVTDPGGTMSMVRVDPEYSRVRAVAGPRVAMPLHPVADVVLRAAVGMDRMSGTVAETALMLEFGIQLSIHLGQFRIGVEGAIPVAFHDSEQPTETPIAMPQFGHRPGYGQAVDWIGALSVGAVF